MLLTPDEGKPKENESDRAFRLGARLQGWMLPMEKLMGRSLPVSLSWNKSMTNIMLGTFLKKEMFSKLYNEQILEKLLVFLKKKLQEAKANSLQFVHYLRVIEH